MVQMYTIAGRQIGSHYLAIGVLGSLAALATSFSGGSSAKKATQGPPINAGSSDEEKFIKDFLAKADQDGKPDSTKK